MSKTLLYHYFPDGRPELYREVMERLVGEVVESVQSALRTPTTTDAGWRPSCRPCWRTSRTGPTPTAC